MGAETGQKNLRRNPCGSFHINWMDGILPHSFISAFEDFPSKAQLRGYPVQKEPLDVEWRFTPKPLLFLDDFPQAS